MQRRHFLRLFGVSTVAAAVGSQLPAVAAPVAMPIPTPVPAINPVLVEWYADLYRRKVEEDMLARIKSGNHDADYEPHRNPYVITKADLGLASARDLLRG